MKAKIETASPSRTRGPSKKKDSNQDRNDQKQVEQSLQEYEAILAHAEEVAKLGSWKWDLRTKKVTWSEGMFRLFGVDREGFDGDLNQIIASRIHPDDVAAVNESNRKALEEGVTIPISYRIVLPDGMERTVWAQGKLLSDENGQPRVLTGYVQDISERKRTQEELRQSEEKFRTVFENSPDIVLTVDREMRIQFINRVSVGISREEAFLSNCLDYVLPEYRQLVKEKIGWVFQTGQPDSFEAQALGDHNSTAWYSTRLAPIKVGDAIDQVLLITSDITVHKQAEEKLRQSEERYRLISENTADVIWVLDPLAGRLMYVSPSVEKLSGYSLAEIMKLPISQLLTPASLQRVNRLLSGYLPTFIETGSGTKSFTQEIDHPRKDGSILHTEVTTTFLFNQQGEVEIIGVSRDITGRRQTEQALRENEERLRLSLQAANQGLYDLNVQTGAAVVNREYAEMLGYEYETFVETNARWIERLHPDDREGVAQAYRDYVSGLRPDYRIEFRQRTRDGGWKWILSLGKVIEYNEQGEPLRMLGTHTDITERKRAEEGLRASEERYRNLIENMNDLVMEVDANGNYCYLSPNYSSITEYPLEEELGGPALKHIHPDDLPMVLQKLGQAFTMERQSATYRVKRNNGEWCWLETVGKPYHASDGSIHLITVARDITERKLAEEALKKSEQQFRALVTASSEVLYRMSPDWSIMSQLKGNGFLSNTEQPDPDWVDKYIHPDDQFRVIAAVQEAIRTKSVFELEHRVLRVDGSLGWTSSRAIPVLDTNGDIQEWFGAASNITERKQAEDALKQNEHVLRLFVEHSPASIAMLDRDMRYIVASRRYLADYRLGDQELTGRSHYDVFPEIPEHWKEIHRRCLQGAVEKEEEDPFPREDGTLDWVRWEIRPWFEETGGVGGIILFSEVITERKQIQDNLRLLNVSLEQRVAERTMELSYANRAKDEFLANMSHELRTPLNAILGLSESLLEQRRGPLNERQVQSIELIVSSGKHLLNLINDILEVSKIEAGRLDLHTDNVSIKELCTSSLNFIKELALKKLIVVEFTSEESISTFEADPQRVKQILINLLTNAVKFTPERGRVGLEVSTNATRDRVLFSVTDTGIGIPQEDLKKIFTPFTQLDSSLARQYAGTGLGLSLVQKLTEAHGGSVEVESEPGKGSRFTVTLPLKQDTEGRTADHGSIQLTQMHPAPEAAPGILPKPVTVLLAEDNQVNSDMIITYLEICGYIVRAAQNGEEVLQKVEETAPDIILMDIQMPKMDGLETTHRLRQDPRFAATPIIALTALVMPGDRERCFEAGVNEYLSKPVSLKTLVSVIEKLTC